MKPKKINTQQLDPVKIVIGVNSAFKVLGIGFKKFVESDSSKKMMQDFKKLNALKK